MKRRASAIVEERNSHVLERIEALKADHPFWGYRRVWAHLRYIDNLEVNRKRVYRLMAEHSLLVKADTHLKAVRTSRSKPQPIRPNEWWGIDMTKVMVTDFGWMYIVIVLDWYTKKILGYYAGIECRAVHWLEALDMAADEAFPQGVYGQEIRLMSDNGSQPTSVSFMRSCRAMGITQAFTSYGNPKGNADTERMFRTMKEELFWIREWRSPFELADALRAWINYYNESYLHSALGYSSPNKFEKEYQSSQITPLARA